MTDDEINHKFEVVAQHIANLAISQEKANERGDRIERQIEHLGEALIQLTESHNQTQQTMTEMQRGMTEMQRAMVKLAESQAHTDRRLDALIDIVREDRERREWRGGGEGKDES